MIRRKFGDIILNPWASHQDGRVSIYVRTIGKGIQVTDGKGTFWLIDAKPFRCPWNGDERMMEPNRVVGSVFLTGAPPAERLGWAHAKTAEEQPREAKPGAG